MRIRFGVAVSGAVFFALAIAGQTQPVIYPSSVLNGASFMRPSLPGGSIGRGSVFSVFGAGIGPTKGVQVSAFPLQPDLAGVSITATQGTTTVNVIPLYVSASQVNAIMPSNTPLGLVSLVLTYNGQHSNPSPVRVANSSFGSFSASSGGFGPAAVLNFVSQSSQPANSLTASANPGQIVTLYGTGLGPVSADNEAPTPGNLPTPVDIWVGGKQVAASDILYSGRTPCCSGIDQLVFRLPTDSPLGCYVPLLLRTDRAVVSNATTLSIQGPGQPRCSDAQNPLAPLFQTAGKAGAVLLSRIQFLAQIDRSQPLSFTADFGTASFSEENGSPFNFNSHLAFPPPGSCTIYTGKQDLLFDAALPATAPSVRFLDAGAALQASSVGSSRSIPKEPNPGTYGGLIGSDLPGIPVLPFLNPGAYSISGNGGADVGSLKTIQTVAPVLNFTGLDGLVNVPRNKDLTFGWETPAAGVQLVAIAGSNYDVPTDSSAAFFCTALPSDLSLTVPSWILSTLPPSRAKRHQSHGRLLLGTFSYGGAESDVKGVKSVQPISISVKGQSVLFR